MTEPLPPTLAYTRSEHLRALWPWLPLWLVFALVAIFSHGPMPMFSTRTLAVAWEMWVHHSWLVPQINGQPYSEKVPLLFWLIHAGWFVFGVSDIWPRVLEVLFGATQLILITVLSRRLFPERPWVARSTPWMLMALTYAFLFGQQIMYEVLLACCVLSALLCLTPTARRAEPRWLLFALAVGAGLLSKGPVMFVHVAFPLLLGPLWNDYARTNPKRWYGFGVLALLGGGAILLAWALPAGFSGGEAYRQRLFFTQTAGRVVKAFDHAQPIWWYLIYLPVLMFPFSAWPRATAALVMMRRPFSPGVRFLFCWLLPTFIVFSLISGKQAYYPLPEFGGGVMLIAAAISLLREHHPVPANHYALGTWPLSLGGFVIAVALFVLPGLVASGRVTNMWLVDMAPYSRFFGVVFLLLGGLLLMRGRGETRRLAVAGLIGSLALNSLWTLGAWNRYDLAPASTYLGQADAGGRPIGNLGPEYNGQYHFAGRLTHPLVRLNAIPGSIAGDDDDAPVSDGMNLEDFARLHPDGLVVTYRNKPTPTDLRYALLVQPSRSTWLMIWNAPTLAALNAGRIAPEPVQPTLLYPADYWRQRNMR